MAFLRQVDAGHFRARRDVFRFEYVFAFVLFACVRRIGGAELGDADDFLRRGRGGDIGRRANGRSLRSLESHSLGIFRFCADFIYLFANHFDAARAGDAGAGRVLSLRTVQSDGAFGAEIFAAADRFRGGRDARFGHDDRRYYRAAFGDAGGSLRDYAGAVRDRGGRRHGGADRALVAGSRSAAANIARAQK